MEGTMTNTLFFHSECGGRLSLWADLIYCANCGGSIPVDLPPEMESTDIIEFLPCLMEADIIAITDFHGMALKQI
jgi:hypothetical protein